MYLLLPVAIVYLVACYENKAEDDHIIASPTTKVSIYKKKSALVRSVLLLSLNVDSNASAVATTVVVIVIFFRLIEKERAAIEVETFEGVESSFVIKPIPNNQL